MSLFDETSREQVGQVSEWMEPENISFFEEKIAHRNEKREKVRDQFKRIYGLDNFAQKLSRSSCSSLSPSVWL